MSDKDLINKLYETWKGVISGEPEPSGNSAFILQSLPASVIESARKIDNNINEKAKVSYTGKREFSPNDKGTWAFAWKGKSGSDFEKFEKMTYKAASEKAWTMAQKDGAKEIELVDE